jgi:hypothetical protein
MNDARVREASGAVVQRHGAAEGPVREACAWESRDGTRNGTGAGRRGLRGDGSACPPGLTIGRRAAFGETWIAKIAETFYDSYLYQ